MDFHVVTYVCRAGRYRTRTFPQSPYQRDHRAKMFLDRCLSGLDVQGINYDLKIIGRTEYIATHYDRSPYRAPIPEPFQEATIHIITYTFLGCPITKIYKRRHISDVFACLKMLQALGLSFEHNFHD